MDSEQFRTSPRTGAALGRCGYLTNCPMLVDSGLEGEDHDVLANLPSGGNPGHRIHGFHGS